MQPELLKNDTDTYVQYGCGFSVGEGWLNFDASPTLRLERLPFVGGLITKNSQPFPRQVQYGDIVGGLPLKPDSCAGVYCSHILEHLSREDCLIALKNTRTTLMPGGVFRLVLPDLEYFAKRYIASGGKDAAHMFMHDSGLGQAKRPRGVTGLLTSFLGNSEHRWMWDYESMSEAPHQAGYVGIRRAQFGDGADPMFTRVESENRWINCLGIECSKPEI